MSRRGMGGRAYDAMVEQMNPSDVREAGVLICSMDELSMLQTEFDSQEILCVSNEAGYAGTILGIPIWIDNRFDKPVFVSGN